MDENAIRQWLIDCFGPIQGEMAWNQLSNMPEAVRDQLMSQDPSTLPKRNRSRCSRRMVPDRTAA